MVLFSDVHCGIVNRIHQLFCLGTITTGIIFIDYTTGLLFSDYHTCGILKRLKRLTQRFSVKGLFPEFGWV